MVAGKACDGVWGYPPQGKALKKGRKGNTLRKEYQGKPLRKGCRAKPCLVDEDFE
jgi:hypothetical protein